MRKILFGILISMLLIFSVFASSMPSNIEKTDQIKNFDEHIYLNLSPKEFKFGIKSLQEGDFSTIELENEGLSNDFGKAQLPVIRKLIEIPQSAEPNIIIESISWEKTSLVEKNLPGMIIPCQFSIEKIPDSKNEFIIDEEYYQTNSYLPDEIAIIRETGEIRGRCFALIEISPVRYNPLTGEIKLMKSCKISINLPNSDMDKTISEINRYSTSRHEQFFEIAFENYGIFEEGLNPRSQDGYLIIVHDDFYDEIQPLVTHKESLGYDVTTTKTSDIPGGTSKENIHNYIEDAYDTWTIPPAYVLLVGDVPQIPTYTGSSSYSEADLYYVTVDGTDYFPDIYIGRFPGSTDAHIEEMVEKTIYYEEGVFESYEWIKKAAFIASSDHGQLAEQTHNFVIDTFLIPNGYTCDKIYEASGGSTSDITNALNDGRSICVYSGHGYSGGWGCVPYDQTDVNNLDNEGMYPFVCSHACSTNPFGNTECYGETWLRAEDKGAIAFWGASASTLWDEDDILERAMFQSWWSDGLDWIGGMTDMALMYLYENYSGGSYTQYYFEAYNINGDPSVRIWSNNPSEPPHTPDAPDGPSQWIINVDSIFSTSTIDPNGDSIYYLFDWGDGTFSKWLGPYTSGQTVEEEHAWSEIGEYEVKVRAKDTYNSQSDWSDALIITIVEDEAPEIPEIAGPNIVFGGREVEFSFKANDPEGHDIYFKIDWDDGEQIDWIGPYSSGETVVFSHTWYQKGEYYIKAWARDIFEKESGQGWHRINVPLSKTRNVAFTNLFAKILSNRPILARVLYLL